MTITNYKPIEKGALVASFDLQLPSGILFHGVLLMTKDGRHWPSWPGIPYEKDGKKDYQRVVSIPDRATRDKFSDQVINALKSAGHL